MTGSSSMSRCADYANAPAESRRPRWLTISCRTTEIRRLCGILKTCNHFAPHAILASSGLRICAATRRLAASMDCRSMAIIHGRIDEIVLRLDKDGEG